MLGRPPDDVIAGILVLIPCTDCSDDVTWKTANYRSTVVPSAVIVNIKLI